MAKPIDIAILFEENKAQCDWSSLKGRLEGEVNCQITDVATTREGLDEVAKTLLEKNDIILVDVPFRIMMENYISHQTVKSHFMNYCDYLEKKDDKWWAQSIFMEFFYPTMLDVIRLQKFKGPAIFLGITPLCIPILDTLSRIGVSEVAFLEVDDQASAMDLEFHESLKSLFGIKFTIVDSTTFIQSEKEYAYCFVAKENYRSQILDDMSYFHFLSQRSTVFDLSGKSNFLFSEVRALGVSVIKEEHLRKSQVDTYFERIRQFDALK